MLRRTGWVTGLSLCYFCNTPCRNRLRMTLAVHKLQNWPGKAPVYDVAADLEVDEVYRFGRFLARLPVVVVGLPDDFKADAGSRA
jgi:hypothetical protein